MEDEDGGGGWSLAANPTEGDVLHVVIFRMPPLREDVMTSFFKPWEEERTL